MPAETWLTLGILVMAIVGPIGGFVWGLNERASRHRERVYSKVEEVHDELGKFRTESAFRFGAIEARLSSIERRSWNVRASDPSGE